MFASKAKPTVIAEGLRIIGNVSADGAIQVNGQIDGDLNCTSITVSPSALINGAVKAQRVVINGKVEGPINGADVVLNRNEVDIARTIREQTNKRGVDVVVDNVGKDTWEQSLRALGRRGRLVTCGATSGPVVETDVRRLFWNQWSILGSTMGNDAEFDAVIAELWAGRLMPPVDSVHALADGRAAFERLASGEQFGKVVIRVS